jgi:hypothetical protein
MADEWYYAKNGQQLGPVSTAVLTEMAAQGQVQPTDLVWREGMPNWAPARTVRGIYPDSAPTAASVPNPPSAGAAYGLSPEPIPAAIPYSEPPRAHRPQYAEPGEEYWERPRRRPKSSANTTVLVVGISLAVLVVIGIIILLIVLLRPGNPRSFNLNPNEKYTCTVDFKAGVPVDIWVNSDYDSDVDLFVFDNVGREVIRDDGPSKNCYVRFVPAQTQTYKIVVWNRILAPQVMQNHRNRSNRCTLKWTPP